MATISKRFLDRAKPNLRRYQNAFESARARDVNESDTCVIISDFLQDVLGYDKYSEVTTEFAVRSTFCDLAIKVGGRLQYLIEVKSAGTDLKSNHLRQAVDYAANQGVEWVLLTNGVQWKAYRIRFERPIQHEEVFFVDLLDPAAKPAQILERMYLVSKEAGGNAAIATYWQHKEATSRFILAQLLLDEPAIGVLRRELRRLYPGIRIDEPTLAALLRDEVIKRDCLDGERATAAQRVVRRATRRRERATADAAAPPLVPIERADALPLPSPPQPRSGVEDRGRSAERGVVADDRG
jgi:hypothetical protein